MKKTPALPLLFLVAVLVSGCTGFKTATLQQWPSESVELDAELSKLYADVASDSGSIAEVDGFADIWIRTPARKERVFSSIQRRKSGEMRIIVSSGLLDWPVADMLFRPDSLFVHDLVNNRLFVGNNTPDNIEKILGVRSGYRLLSEAVTGSVSIEEPLASVRSVKRGFGKVSYTIATASGSKELLVDPATRLLEALVISDASGGKRLEMHFRRFLPYSSGDRSISLPAEIDLLMFHPALDGGGKQEMVIVYDERTLDPEKNGIEYRFPEKARVIELDKVGALPWM